MIQSQFKEAEIIECQKAEEALCCAAETHILLLDIDTGTTMDGMDAARIIYSRKKEEGRISSLPLIIFITGFPERMREAFDVHAFSFIEKPVKPQILLPVLEEAASVAELIMEETKKTSADRCLIVNGGDQTMLVPFHRIRYVESSGRIQVLHIAKGGQEEEVSYPGSMDELEQKFPYGFYRIHRGYIVNMSYITGYGKDGITLSDGSRLLISRYKYKEFVERYLHFIGFEG